MAKGKIADKYLHRTRFFSMTRKPYQEGEKIGKTSGRFSPKSGLIFIKAGPKFSELTPQQEKIAKVGKMCGNVVKGIKDYKERTKKMGLCVRKAFGYAVGEKVKELA